MDNKLKNYIETDEMLKAKNALIDSQYNATKTALDDSARQQRIKADISNRRLMKYLPQVLKSQGLSGNLGASESAMIDANNKYTTALGQIDTNYNQGIAALNNQRQESMLGLYGEAKAGMESKYTDLAGNISSWDGDYASLIGHLEEYKDILTDDQYNNLLNEAKANKESITNNYELKEKYIGESRKVSGLKEETKAGDNINVNLDGTTYKVEIGNEYDATDKETIMQRAKDKGINSGEVFYFGGKVYLMQGEKLYVVQDRKSEQTHGLEGLTKYLDINNDDELSEYETKKKTDKENRMNSYRYAGSAT